MRQTVLITGADGLIGSHLSEALASRYDLRLLQDIPYRARNPLLQILQIGDRGD